MPTRRAIVLGTMATGIAMHPQRLFAKASQPATPVNFEVPADACDCHTHILAIRSNSRSSPAASRLRSRPRCIAPCTSSASSS